jgi:hypothetical protein
MAELVRFMDRLHVLVGDRRVYVDRTGTVSPPAVYFLADLRPGPFRQDYGTMVLNSDIRATWLRDFRARTSQIEAVVTTNRRRAAPALWLRAHPRHATIALRFGPRNVFVLLASGGRPPPGI